MKSQASAAMKTLRSLLDEQETDRLTDLETRLRDGLHGDLEYPDVDHLLASVRRGAAWRRDRRASAGVAVLVAAVIGGSTLLQQSHDDRTAPQPITHGPSPTADSAGRVTGLATGGSHLYRLTSNAGCTACSGVWLRADDGSWTHLADIAGAAAYAGQVSPRYGPLDSLEMAPNGQDGWAWGRTLWSTHDGGRTWSMVSDPTSAPTPGGGRRTPAA